jgi:uncharacterized protein with HEPN domain
VPSRDPRQRLQDILVNGAAAREFIAGMDLSAFAADRKAIYAVVRALEIISEASRRLPEEMRNRHQEVDWQAVAAAGNIYRHEYDVVHAAIVWQTVFVELPTLEAAVRVEIDRLDKGPDRG